MGQEFGLGQELDNDWGHKPGARPLLQHYISALRSSIVRLCAEYRLGNSYEDEDHTFLC